MLRCFDAATLSIFRLPAPGHCCRFATPLIEEAYAAAATDAGLLAFAAYLRRRHYDI